MRYFQILMDIQDELKEIEDPLAEAESNEEAAFEMDENEIIEKMNYLIHETDYFNQGNKNDGVNVFMFYMTNKKLENFKKLSVPLTMNKISKDNLISIILKNKNVYGNKYTITGISKYNFNLSKDKLCDFILNEDDYEFMTSVGKLSEIPYDVSIDIFQNYNYLFIFLNNNSKRKTKKHVSFTNHVEISTSRGKTMKRKMNE
jgi:hypothetical protein